MEKKIVSILAVSSIMALTLIIQIISASYTESALSSQVEKSAAEKELLIAQETGEILKQSMVDLRNNVELMLRIDEIRTGGAQECNRELSEVYPIVEPRVDNLFRINSDGIVDCAIVEEALGYDASVTEETREMLANPDNILRVSNVTYSPPTDRWIISVHMPLADDNGNSEGIIGLVVDTSKMREKFLTGIEESIVRRTTVVDQNGDVIYSYNNSLIGRKLSDLVEAGDVATDRPIDEVYSEVFSGGSGIVRYEQDERFIAAYSSVEVFPGRNWTVIAVSPVSDLVPSSGITGTGPFFTLMVTLGAVIILSAAALVLMLVWKVFRPLEQVTESIEKLSMGDTNISLDPSLKEGKDEIGRLAAAFERTLVSLKLVMRKGGK